MLRAVGDRTSSVDPLRSHRALDTTNAVASAAALILLGWANLDASRPWTVAALVAAAVVYCPGLVVVRSLRQLEPWACWALAPAVGGALLGVAAYLMLTFGGWHPTAVVAGFLLAALVGSLVRAVRAGPGQGRTAPTTSERSTAPSDLSATTVRRLAVRIVLVVAVLVLWLQAVRSADVERLGSWGLLPLLPAGWYVAFVTTVVWAAVEVVRTRSPRAPMVPLLLLQVLIYATPALVEPVARYPWVYKHIAVADYFATKGAISPDLDIYQRWPTFFGAAAVVDSAVGVRSSAQYAAWAELVFAVVNVGLVVALAFLLTRTWRTAWAAGTFFSLTNWIGQNYFAPQAYAYAIALAVMFLLLAAAPAGAPSRLAQRVEGAASRILRSRDSSFQELLPRRDHEPDRGGRNDTSRKALALVVPVLVLVLHAVVTASHQLTPYILVMGLVPLAVLGYLRPRWVPLLMAVVTVAYLFLNLDYIRSNFGVFSGFDPLDNATYTPSDRSLRPLPSVLQGYGTWVLTGIAYAAGSIGLLRRARAGMVRQALVVGWLAFSPGLLLAGQTYGGEGRLRVVLFALPWLCTAAAWAFWPRSGATIEARRPRAAALGFGLPLVVVAALFCGVSLQPESNFHVAPPDLRAARWLTSRSAPQDIVIVPVQNVPLPVSAGQGAPEVLILKDTVRSIPGPLNAKTAEEYARAVTGADGDAWMLFSDAASQYCSYNCPFTPGDLARLESSLPAEGYTRVYDEDGARVYRKGA